LFYALDNLITAKLQSHAFVAVFLTMWYFAGPAGIGSLVLRRLQPATQSLFVKIACGIVLSAIAALILPMWWLHEYIAPLLLTPFVCFGIHDLYKTAKKNKISCWWYLLFAAIMVYTLGNALYPPYAWDEQVYQISLLRRYCAAGSGAVCLDNPYSAYPSLPHFALSYIFPAGGINIPRLSIWMMLPILFAAWAWELRIYGTKNVVPVLAVIFISPLVLSSYRAFYTDIWVAFFATAGVIVIERLRSEDDSVPAAGVLLCGLFAGAAMAVKFTGASAAIALTVMILPFYRKIIFFIAGGTVALLPFLLRICLETGDPLYPYLSALAGNEAAASVASFHHALGTYRYGLEGVPGIALGWIFSAFDAKLYDGIVTGWQMPLLVLLGAAGLFFRYQNGKWYSKRHLPLAAAVAAAYLFWSLTSQQSRFLWPFLGIVAWGAVAALSALSKRNRLIVCTVVVLAGVLSLAPGELHTFRIAWKNLDSARKTPSQHLAAVCRDADYIASMDKLCGLPEKSRVLMLFEKRTLYLDCDIEIGDPYFQQANFYPLRQSSADFAEAIKSFDYLYIGSAQVEADRLEDYEIVRQKMRFFAAQLINQQKLEPYSIINNNWILKIRK
jgi:hypothetical protein